METNPEKEKKEEDWLKLKETREKDGRGPGKQTQGKEDREREAGG